MILPTPITNAESALYMDEDNRVTLPLVLIPCGIEIVDGLSFHAVGENYIAAVERLCNAMTLTVPAQYDDVLPVSTRIDRLLSLADGILLTGSPSNVAPLHYDSVAQESDMLTDPCRDALTLPLIRAAIAAGCPLLAICRGIQELNVALGGTLHQNIHDVAGVEEGFAARHDHRADRSRPIAERYGLAHKLILCPDGFLYRLIGTPEVMVNSLHSQAIDSLAEDLAVDAWSDDGVIEAVRVKTARNFAYGVQWHPEWNAEDIMLSRRLFSAFGTAVADYADHRHGRGKPGKL